MERFQPKFLISSLLLAAAFLAPSAAIAQQNEPRSQSPSNWFVGGGGPGPIPDEAKTATVTEHLNAKIPLDLSFVDDAGYPVQLKQYFNGKKPVVLQMGYFGCPMLCSLVSQGLVQSLKDLKLNAGSDYEVVYVSIDPTEGPGMAKSKKDAYLQAYGREASSAGGWHLLTGKKEQIEQLAQAVGFGYKWIDSAQQFTHPACLFVLTPDGRVSRYLYGVKFDAPTVRLSLVEASDGKVGSTADRFILTCFQYDGTQGRYSLAAIKLMKGAGIFTVFAVAGMVFWLSRWDSGRKKPEARGEKPGARSQEPE